MAIVVEEQRTPRGGGTGWASVIIWLLVLVLIGAGAYYVFFTQPDLVEVVAPSGFQETQVISQIDLDPSEVLGNPRFRDLRAYVTLTQTGLFGKENPFVESSAPAAR